VKPETDPQTGAVLRPGRVRFHNTPNALLAQLSTPKYATDSQGRIVVERKRDTKRRMGGSPDLADAVNLAVYEPPGQSSASIDRATSRTVPTGHRAAEQAAAGRAGRPGILPKNRVPIGPPGQRRSLRGF
jgi:hypothetical protein